MKYIEITHNDGGFHRLKLKRILADIAGYAEIYTWTIQAIWAMGDIRNIVGMNYVAFEERVESSGNGLVLPFDSIRKLSEAFDDVIDITIVGCADIKSMPKAFKEDDWEDKCDVIITRGDSSWWSLYSRNPEITKIFQSYRKNLA